MQKESENLRKLVSLILPEELEKYFIITNVESTPETVVIYMDEDDVPPAGTEGHQLASKGFLDPVSIRDFPLRDRKVTFVIRRRKWYDATVKGYISNRFDVTSPGTRHSKEFAAFLKGMLGEIPDYGPLS